MAECFDLLKSDQQDLDLRPLPEPFSGEACCLRKEQASGYLLEPCSAAKTILLRGRRQQLNKMPRLSSAPTSMYPSLSDPGRVRLSSDSNLHVELIKDFYWDFHLYENFDSRPPVNAPRNDLGVATGIGWKF